MILSALALWLCLINLVTYAAFAQDKASAVQNRWRTPEARLLFLALIGGWPAAKIAQKVLRHKTRKQPFARQLNAVPLFQALLLGGALIASSAIGLSHEFRESNFAQAASKVEKAALPRRFGPGS